MHRVKEHELRKKENYNSNSGFTPPRRAGAGFTLLEIMLVASIIVLLTAIAIPNLLRARMEANETVALLSLRAICTVMENYRAHNNGSYNGANLNALSSVTPPYIDSVLGSGTKQGYKFEITVLSASQYWAKATPTIPVTTGVRSFYLDEQGVVCAGEIIPAGHAAQGSSCPVGMSTLQS